MAQQLLGMGNQAHGQPPMGINQNYVQPPSGGERAQPVLGNQPPLPGAAMVRYIQPEETNQETTLVPLEACKRETNDVCVELIPSYEPMREYSNVVPEGHYRMDHNTLWFIANAMGG